MKRNKGDFQSSVEKNKTCCLLFICQNRRKNLFFCPYRIYVTFNFSEDTHFKYPGIKPNSNFHCLFTPPNSEIIRGQNVGTKVVGGMILFSEKKAMLKI